MKKNILVSVFSLGLMVVPAIAFGYVDGLKTLLGQDVPALIKSIWYIATIVPALYFFWGMIDFIQNAGNEDKRAEGQQKMLWGIIALMVIWSIFGVIGLFGNILGIPSNNGTGVPGLCSSTNSDPNCLS